MSMTTPTTAEINANIIAQLEASLNQTIPLLPKSFLRVLARVLAGVFILLYKYCGFMLLQMFVRTASTTSTTVNGVDVTPLEEWGQLIGVGLPTPATQAELTIDITVEVQVGSLPSGTQLFGATNGVTYITVGAVALSAATVSATIRAVSDQAGGSGAGIIGNLSPGDTVGFANPLANVAGTAVVTAQTVTGADAEDPEVYRQRVLDRFQQRPQGGAYADYSQWGEEVAGIVNVYPYTGDPGQVDVYAEATIESSGDPDGIPTSAQLDAVELAIQYDDAGLASRRPANAYVNVYPITRAGFDVNISGLSVDNVAQVQSDITDAVEEYMWVAAPHIDGLTVPPRTDRITRSALIGLVNDIVAAENGTFTSVTFTPAGSPGSLDVYILQEGEKAKATSVTFV